MYRNIAIIGSSGALGSAMLDQLVLQHPDATIHTFARQPRSPSSPQVHTHIIDYEDESAIEAAAEVAAKDQPLDLVLVTTGILHEGAIQPEKSLKALSAANFQRLFAVNTILPALVAKHFLPKLNKTEKAIFAALSARVGSISDNHLGGWYAYRASKAALNMVIKTASIELYRTAKQAIVVGLHPGTVDSPLSKPFQSGVPDSQLFTPEFSATQLLVVLDQLSAEDTGKCFAWDGQEILP